MGGDAITHAKEITSETAAEGDAGGSDDAGLDDGVLLSSEGLRWVIGKGEREKKIADLQHKREK